jgi:SAM-dependent methyltransferase
MRPAVELPAGDVEAYFTREHWAHPLTELERFRLRETAMHLPSRLGAFLDVGCGDGRLIRMLREDGRTASFVGCDGSEAGLELAADIPVARCDVRRLPFPDASFDCVACCEVLEHLSDTALAETVAELQRVSRAYLYVTVPCDEDLRQGLCRCRRCGHVFHVHGHVQRFPHGRLEALFADGWRPLRSGVFGTGRRRRYRPWILQLKQSALDCWAWASDLHCPSCGAAANGANRRWARALCGGLNALFTPSKTGGGWLYALLARR